MPKRPRSHVLEDLSKQAVRQALPPHWILRWEAIDYGIDGHVEIVDDEGIVSGLVFGVQVKATDREDGASVRISRETLTYYTLYAVPVLLLYYVEPAGLLYGRWVNEVMAAASPEEKRRWRNQDTIAIPFASEHEITASTASEIHTAVQESLSSRVRRPLVTVAFAEFSSDDENERSPVGLRNQVWDETSDWLDLLAPSRILLAGAAAAPREADLLVELHVAAGTATLRVAFGDDTIAALYPAEVIWEGAVAEIPYWVIDTGGSPKPAAAHTLLAVGYALAAKGDADTASKLLIRAAPVCVSFLSTNPLAVLALVVILSSGRRLGDAVILADEFIERGEVATAETLLNFVHISPEASGATRRILTPIYEKCARGVEDKDRGRLNYNLANILRAQGEIRPAVRAYMRARKGDPQYEQRHYWWQELAGMLFTLGHYTWAADCYARSMKCELPETPIHDGREEHKEATERYWLAPDRALYADALLHAGEYSAAINEFETYFAEVEDPSAEWRLVCHLLKLLHLNGLTADGPRMGRQARAKAQEARDHLENADVASASACLEEAISQDPLEAEVWYVAEEANMVEEDWEDLIVAQAMQAICNGHRTSWAVATVNCFASKGDHSLVLLMLLATSGAEKFGTPFFEDIAHQLRTNAGVDAMSAKHIQTTIRLIVDQNYNLAQARADGLPVPPELGDGSVAPFVKRETNGQRDPSEEG